MKKLLLLAACFMGLNAWADETVITMADGADAFNAAVATWNTQGFNLTTDSKGGNNNPTVNATSGDLRNYANGTFTIETNVPITAISFEISAKGLQRFAELEVNAGTIAEQGANPLVWNGNAKSVTFTVGATSIGTETGKAGQFDFTTITITTDGTPSLEGETPDTPEGGALYTGLVDNMDDWTITNVNLPEGLEYVWNWKVYNNSGYLNGSAYKDGANAAEAYATTTIDLTAATEAHLTFDHAAKFQTTLRELCGLVVKEEGAAAWTSVAIPTWPEAGAWTFANSGDIDLTAYAGKKIEIGFKYGSSAEGADTWEIKNFVVTSDAAVEPDPTPDPEPDPEPTPDDAAYTGLVDNADDWYLYTDWTYPEPEEGEEYAEIWKWDAKYGLKASGRINNVNIETEAIAYSPWIDLTEYTDCVLTFEHAVNYLDASKYDTSWYLAAYAYDSEAYYAEEDEEAGVYEMLDVPTWPAGTNWAFVNSGNVDLSDFDGTWMTVFFYYYSGPTEEQADAYEAGTITEEELVNVTATWEIKNFVITGVNKSGVREVIVDNNAPVEYYNLNGVRVAQPTSGLYIVRQGNNVSKVVVK